MTGPTSTRRYTVVDFKTGRAIAGTDSLTVAATIARRERRAGRLVFVRFNFTMVNLTMPPTRQRTPIAIRMTRNTLIGRG
jgi:hypothetical protein